MTTVHESRLARVSCELLLPCDSCETVRATELPVLRTTSFTKPAHSHAVRKHGTQQLVEISQGLHLNGTGWNVFLSLHYWTFMQTGRVLAMADPGSGVPASGYRQTPLPSTNYIPKTCRRFKWDFIIIITKKKTSQSLNLTFELNFNIK